MSRYAVAEARQHIFQAGQRCPRHVQTGIFGSGNFLLLNLGSWQSTCGGRG